MITIPEPIIDLLIALAGGGVAGGLVTYFMEKKLRAYELKLQKYLEIGTALVSIPISGKISDDEMKTLNGALVFGSNEVATEMLNLIHLIEEKESTPAAQGESKDVTADEFKPLLFAIRKDLNLQSSCSLRSKTLRFFGR